MILSRKRYLLVGVMILVAYTMLAYDITNVKSIGMVADIISGLAVIAIPLLLKPALDIKKQRLVSLFYFISRLAVGLLMVAAGILILLNPPDIRAIIYSDIHIWTFILGAVAFYIVLLVNRIVPKYISIWGLSAAILMLISNFLMKMGLEIEILSFAMVPMILNEVYLAVWMIVKGGRKK